MWQEQIFKKKSKSTQQPLQPLRFTQQSEHRVAEARAVEGGDFFLKRIKARLDNDGLFARGHYPECVKVFLPLAGSWGENTIVW